MKSLRPNQSEVTVSTIAAAIGDRARARILYCLVDGRARTSTELSVVADVSPSTTSVHLERLRTAKLVSVLVQGRHRFYSLAGPDVARALEGLSILAGGSRHKFAPSTPNRLRLARTCYDHLAGTLGVVRAARRRFACACLDWSERRPHLGGALGSCSAESRAREEMGDPGSRQ